MICLGNFDVVESNVGVVTLSQRKYDVNKLGFVCFDPPVFQSYGEGVEAFLQHGSGGGRVSER